MKKTFFIGMMLLAISCSQQSLKTPVIPANVSISKEVLEDKIKGGWAGQTIGVTYGAPTEFKYATFMPDYTPIEWNDDYIKWWLDESTGLWDDIYMDMTFVEVFERAGFEAPIDSFAHAFAHAAYRLWHGNQAARYNILQGIKAPESGHWMNNPHADDLDYQIESDFAGLMSPGMPNTASAISDKIGHIMTYGDGWYGGVYVGALYSLAFVSDNMEFVVSEALKTIPPQSKYYQCISDVIQWHKEYPNDWRQAWLEVNKKWAEDIGCPRSVFTQSNIDATLNSAYIVIGLLYGEKDFYKTIDISTRCGQDSDCNPANAGGILGTMIGYSKIPEYWMRGLRKVEDRKFPFTEMSLNKVYEVGMKHALAMVERNGGKIEGNNVTIKYQEPKAVRLEQSFEGMYPLKNMVLQKPVQDVEKIEFEGTGFILKGTLACEDTNYVANVEIYVDGQLSKTMNLPALFHDRCQEIGWIYKLPYGKHVINVKWLNPRKDATLNHNDVLIYTDKKPDVHIHQN